MKKNITILFIFIAVITFFFTGCGEKPANNVNETELHLINSLNLNYIQHLSANVTESTSLGIKKQTLEDISNQEKYYLFQSTEDYVNGVVEYDENSITKVTFIKINTTIEEIRDSEGNIIENNKTITQDEIPAQINKFIINNGFTFIQFIPIVNNSGYYKYRDNNNQIKTSYIQVRPSDKEMQADENGLFEFDKSDYYSDALHQSFVIDNNTGYIYKIENMYIEKVKDGLIKGFNSSNRTSLIYDMLITSENELQFHTILENEKIVVNDFFKDIYGNNYIKNDSINLVDANTKTTFYKGEGEDYLLSDEGYTVYILKTGRTFDFSILDIKLLDNNMTKQEIPNNSSIFFKSTNIKDSLNGLITINKIENGFLYMSQFVSFGYSYFYNLNFETMETEVISYGLYGYDVGGWEYNCVITAPLSFDKVLIWTDKITGSATLYYADVYVENAFRMVGGLIFETNGELNSLITLITNCERAEEWNEDIRRFSVTELTGTTYYLVIVDENKSVNIIKESEYISSPQEIITLQPINR